MYFVSKWYKKRLKAGGEGDDRGWDGWMASLIQWTWVWAGSGSWWWTGKPSVLQSMGSKRVGHDWAMELNKQGKFSSQFLKLIHPFMTENNMPAQHSTHACDQHHLRQYLGWACECMESSVTNSHLLPHGKIFFKWRGKITDLAKNSTVHWAQTRAHIWAQVTHQSTRLS